jgi:hypothetical protein
VRLALHDWPLEPVTAVSLSLYVSDIIKRDAKTLL